MATLPHTSRHFRPVVGRMCPACGCRARSAGPRWARHALRLLTGDRFSYRVCPSGHWHGLAVHAPHCHAARRPLRSAIPVAFGRSCPVCDHRTARAPTPRPLRLLRRLYRDRLSFRECTHYHWRGAALHAPASGHAAPVLLVRAPIPPARLALGPAERGAAGALVAAAAGGVRARVRRPPPIAVVDGRPYIPGHAAAAGAAAVPTSSHG
jgi:hypothetical protein